MSMRRHLSPIGTVSLYTLTLILVGFLSLPADWLRGAIERPVSMGQAKDNPRHAAPDQVIATRHPTDTRAAEETARGSGNERLLAGARRSAGSVVPNSLPAIDGGIRVEGGQNAACCIGESCSILDYLQCTAAGGSFLAPPFLATPIVVCGPDPCQTGSCCLGPGVCKDSSANDSFIPIDKDTCDGLSGNYIGGLRCAGGECLAGPCVGCSCNDDEDCGGGLGACVERPGEALDQPPPCPLCDIQGPDGGITCEVPGTSLSEETAIAGLPGQTPCEGNNHDTKAFIDTFLLGGPVVGIAWAPTISAPITVTRIEVFTGESTGPMAYAIWSDAAGAPGVNLGNTLSTPIVTPNSWQGADLISPVLILPSTPYWLVFDPSGGEQSPVQSVTTGQTYWGSYVGDVTGGVSWFGPFSFPDRGWKFRMFCCKPLPDGSACTQTGCPSSCECMGGANDGLPCDCSSPNDCPGGTCEPISGNQCVPVCARVVPAPGQTTVIDCDCLPESTCHVEIDPTGDASCVGNCPQGLECVQTITEGPGYVDVCCSCEPPCIPAPADIAHWWPLDEPSGPTAQDTISGADGTHVDGPTPVPGFVAGALSTGGLTGGHVDVPDGPPTLDIDLTAPPFGFTVAFWYKCSDDPACITLPGGKQTAVSKWDATLGVGYILDVGPGGYCWQTGDVVGGGNGL